MWRVVLAVLVVALGACEDTRRPAPKVPVSPAAPDARSRLEIVVHVDRVEIGGVALLDAGGEIDRLRMHTILGDVPEAIVGVAGDVPYRRLVSVLEGAAGAGVDAVLDVGPGGPFPLTHPASDSTGEPKLVLTISSDAMFLGATHLIAHADVSPGDDLAVLRDAIAARAAPPENLYVIADLSAPADLVLRALGTARRAGVVFVQLLTDPP